MELPRFDGHSEKRESTEQLYLTLHLMLWQETPIALPNEPLRIRLLDQFVEPASNIVDRAKIGKTSPAEFVPQ